MSKIELFNAAQAVANRIKAARDYVFRLDSPQNDKGSLHVEFRKISDETWSPMIFAIEASYGYYGSSSGYSVTSVELGKYLAKAIKANARKIMDDAVALARDDMELARKAAAEEAKSVLLTVE